MRTTAIDGFLAIVIICLILLYVFSATEEPSHPVSVEVISTVVEVPHDSQQEVPADITPPSVFMFNSDSDVIVESFTMRLADVLHIKLGQHLVLDDPQGGSNEFLVLRIKQSEAYTTAQLVSEGYVSTLTYNDKVFILMMVTPRGVYNISGDVNHSTYIDQQMLESQRGNVHEQDYATPSS